MGKNKFIRYGIVVLLAGFLLYNSIYIKKLSVVKASTPTAFDAAAFSKTLFHEQLPGRIQGAVLLDSLLQALQNNPDQAFEKYTHALAIGNIRYGLVQASGRVTAIKDDEVIIQVGSVPVHLATEYIYGNAIRDASGLVDVKDFVNTTDLNNISESLNKQVREQVLPPFKKAVQQSDSVWFAGALELNREHVHVQSPEVIPVQIKIIE
jgi:Predicted periplasmic lipoprotein